MPIRRSDKPAYRLQLPITKKRVEYTSFNMRAERTLMLATQTGDAEELTTAVINTLNDHLHTDGIKAEELPQAEAELLLLNMRAKSIGEHVELTVKDPEDESITYEAKVDLTKITVQVDPEFSKQVELEDGTLVVFTLPGLTTLAGIDFGSEDDFENTLEVLCRCVKQIVVGEDVYNSREVPASDIKEFFLEMDTSDFSRISTEYFAKLPVLGTDVKVKRQDGSVLEVPITGLASFL